MADPESRRQANASHGRPLRSTHQHAEHQGAHAHAHSHPPADFGRAFLIGIVLNIAFVVAEVVFGLASHSVALLADAGHNLSDVLSLAIAGGAGLLARRAPTARFTYGFGSSSILAALFNAVFLLVVIGALSWEAVGRLFRPEPVAGGTVMVVAAIGIAVNGVCAWLFASGRKGDINVRGAFLHMAADAAVSAGVVLAGLIMVLTNWLWLDPAVSLLVNGLIVWGTWQLLRDGVAMALDAVPPGIESKQVRVFLSGQPGVAGLHDLHIWPLSATETALTAHLVMPGGHPGDRFLMSVCERLKLDYSIRHATLQVETDETTQCALAPEHVV